MRSLGSSRLEVPEPYRWGREGRRRIEGKEAGHRGAGPGVAGGVGDGRQRWGSGTESKRVRERDRETARQRERETVSQRETEPKGERARQRDRGRDRQRDKRQ